MNMKFLFTLLFIALMIAPVAHAEIVVNTYTNDFAFSAKSNEQIKTCSCEPKTDVLFIENVGDFPETYTLEVISPIANWAILSHNSLSLLPGEFAEVPVTIHTPCGETGTFDYDVQATNSFGRTNYLERSLRADQCNNIVLDVQKPAESTNICQPTVFEVTLRNPSRYAETYELDFASYNEYMNVTQETVALAPGETYTQDAVLTLPCSYEGEYDIPFIAKAKKNKLQEKKAITLVLENKFEHALALETQAALCSGVENDISFTLSNTAVDANAFTIDVDGPRFIDDEAVDYKRFVLEGGAKQEVHLVATPAVGKEGNYDVQISAIGQNDGVKKTRDMSLTVENCYALEVETRDASNTQISQDASCCGSKEYAFNIENTGTREQTLRLAVVGPAWITLETTQVTLDPQENANVRIQAEIPCSDEQYDIELRATNVAVPSKVTGIPFTLNTKSEHSCRAIAINKDEFVIDPSDKKIKLVVENEGLEAGVYDISFANEHFSLDETQIELAAGEKQKLKLTVTNLTNADFGRYILEPAFTVAQANNAVSRDITYVESIGVEYEDFTFGEKIGNAVSHVCKTAGWCAAFSILLVLGIIGAVVLVALVVMRKVAPTYATKDLAFARVVLLAIIIVIFIALAIIRMPNPAELYIEPMNPTDYFVVLNQDSWAQFQLNEHFTDPDTDDVLVYSATQPNFVAIEVQEDVLIVRPDEGFTGEQTFTITATDSAGAAVTSPELSLYVREKIELTTYQKWMRICTQLNLGFLLLIILLLLVVSFLVGEKKPPKKETPLVAAKKQAVKKAVKQSAVAKTLQKVAVQMQSLRSKALDRALVSREPHEMRQVLYTHKKSGSKANIAKLQKALKEFKAARGYKPKNRTNFYRYIKEKNVLRTLRNK